MPEPAKNGGAPAAHPDHLLYGNFELFETPTGSRELRFFGVQINKTVGEVKAWGMNLHALEATLTLALKKVRETRTGIVEP